MFFHRLPHFNPYSGHLYDALKVPFVRKGGEIFERSEKHFDLMDREGYFLFKELVTNRQVYFISDENLLDFLKITEDTIRKVMEANIPSQRQDALLTTRQASPLIRYQHSSK